MDFYFGIFPVMEQCSLSISFERQLVLFITSKMLVLPYLLLICYSLTAFLNDQNFSRFLVCCQVLVYIFVIYAFYFIFCWGVGRSTARFTWLLFFTCSLQVNDPGMDSSCRFFTINIIRLWFSSSVINPNSCVRDYLYLYLSLYYQGEVSDIVVDDMSLGCQKRSFFTIQRSWWANQNLVKS